MFFETILGASLAVAAAQAPGVPDISIPMETLFPSGVYLLKARAAATTRYKFWRATPAPVEVEHVYVGEGDVKRTKLALDLYELRINLSPGWQKTSMPVVEGEPIVCWIKGDGQRAWDKEPSRATLKGYPKTGEDERKVAEWTAEFDPEKKAMVRNFERSDVLYELAVTKAQVFEKVYHAGGKDRIKVIDKFVRSGDSVKAAAAISLLRRPDAREPAKFPSDALVIEGNPKIAEYVLPLTKDEAAPPRVQREADQVLLLNKEGWAKSPERRKMYERWFGGSWKEKKDVPWDASEERVVAEAFLYGWSRFPIRSIMDFAIAGLANPSRSDRFKAELVRDVAMARGPGDNSTEWRDDGFAHLVSAINNDRVPARKLAAAKLLMAFTPLSKEQRRYLQLLSGRNLGKEVNAEMKRALAEDK